MKARLPIKSAFKIFACVYHVLLALLGWFVGWEVSGQVGECHRGVCPYFLSSVQHVLLVLFGWFVWWEVSGRVGECHLGVCLWASSFWN